MIAFANGGCLRVMSGNLRTFLIREADMLDFDDPDFDADFEFLIEDALDSMSMKKFKRLYGIRNGKRPTLRTKKKGTGLEASDR